MTDHVLRDGALRHFNTQLEQLAVYAGCAQRGLARLILRIRDRICGGISGRPFGTRLFQVQ